MDPEEAIARLFAGRNWAQSSGPRRPTHGEMLADAIDEYARRNSMSASPNAVSTLLVAPPLPRSGEGPVADPLEYSTDAPRADILNDPKVLAAEDMARRLSRFGNPDLHMRTEAGFQAWRMPDGTTKVVWGGPGQDPKNGLYSDFHPPGAQAFDGGEIPLGARLLLDYHTHPFDGTGDPIRAPDGQLVHILGGQPPSQRDVNGVWTDARKDTWDNSNVLGVVEAAGGRRYYYGPSAPGTVRQALGPRVVSPASLTQPQPIGPLAPPISFLPDGG